MSFFGKIKGKIETKRFLMRAKRTEKFSPEGKIATQYMWLRGRKKGGRDLATHKGGKNHEMFF